MPVVTMFPRLKNVKESKHCHKMQQRPPKSSEVEQDKDHTESDTEVSR